MYNNDESESDADLPVLSPTPSTGRHAILPGVGLAEPGVLMPLDIDDASGPDLPDLDVPGRLPEDNPRLIRRDLELTDDPERALGAMIAECHFLMREVAFRCIIQTSDAQERMGFMNSAMALAKTGAEVAQTVIAFRHAPLSENRLERMLAEVKTLTNS